MPQSNLFHWRQFKSVKDTYSLTSIVDCFQVFHHADLWSLGLANIVSVYVCVSGLYKYHGVCSSSCCQCKIGPLAVCRTVLEFGKNIPNLYCEKC